MDKAAKMVEPDFVIRRLKPGMTIFVGTGVSEPRTLVKELLYKRLGNLTDLELIQLVSFAETCSTKATHSQNFRLKTFIPGNVSEAIRKGFVDLIPARYANIPSLFKTGVIDVDAAFIQVTPPDKSGHCNLGLSADLAKAVVEKAHLVVGEMNTNIPTTFGDTFIHVKDIDFLTTSKEKPIYFTPCKVDGTVEKLSENIVGLIEDKSCLSFTLGPLFDALGVHLQKKRGLGVHTPIFTDALMNLVKSGAVDNKNKSVFHGKCVCSYAFGSKKLYKWLDHNPQVEFQPIDTVFSPLKIGANDQMVVIIPARKVDLSGRVVLQAGVGSVAAGPIEIYDFIKGAENSRKGKVIIGLPSRNKKGRANILLSAGKFFNKIGSEEPVDMIVTEFGVANLKGLTVRERAQSLIDIAHPEDRQALLAQAKKRNILYKDQIYIPESSFLYPENITEEGVFKGGLNVRFRPIKPSDEEQMRKLFYRFSDQAIYARYFSKVSSMPHIKMQEYVNVNWKDTVSVVGLTGEPGQGKIIAEGRYLKIPGTSSAELAFVVDESYQNRGISTFLVRMITKTAQKRGISSFNFEVLFTNAAMMHVFQKIFTKIETTLENGIYTLKIPI